MRHISELTWIAIFLAAFIWFAKICVVKVRTGKDWKTIITDWKLANTCMRIAGGLIIIVLAVAIFLNN